MSMYIDITGMYIDACTNVINITTVRTVLQYTCRLCENSECQSNNSLIHVLHA